MHTHIQYSIIYNRQDMKIAEVSVDCWMDKENVIYMNIIYLKKNDILHLGKHEIILRALC